MLRHCHRQVWGVLVDRFVKVSSSFKKGYGYLSRTLFIYWDMPGLQDCLVEYFLALLDDQAVFKISLGEGLVDIGDFFVGHSEPALLD